MSRPSARALQVASRLEPKRGPRPCGNGHHEGPFTRRPEMDEFVAEWARAAGLPTDNIPPQYHCEACGTDRGFSPREMRRAS